MSRGIVGSRSTGGALLITGKNPERAVAICANRQEETLWDDVANPALNGRHCGFAPAVCYYASGVNRVISPHSGKCLYKIDQVRFLSWRSSSAVVQKNRSVAASAVEAEVPRH